MARKPRVHYEGAIYHVIARGNNREPVFLHDTDKAKYLKLLADSRERYGMELYGYTLMDNHVHVLLRVGQQPLAKGMQVLQQRYTQYFNKKYDHAGHVFEQRYKAYLCEDEAYLLRLVCYIHQNPVRASSKGGINYPWSSHAAYVKGHDSFVNVKFILDCLHAQQGQAIQQYLSLLKTLYSVDDLKTNADLTGEWPERQREVHEAAARESTAVAPAMTWDDLMAQICGEFAVDREQVVSRSRLRSVTAARNKLIYVAVRDNVLTQTEVAKRLGIDLSRVSRVYQELAGRSGKTSQ